MGTPRLPDPKTANGDRNQTIEDVPRVGIVTWLLLGAMLLPPAMVTYIGYQGITIPHQRIWVFVLGAPIFVILLTLPRKYLLDDRQLRIVGLWYRFKVPLDNVRSVSRTSTGEALVYPGSIFCTDPSRAIKIVRKRGITLLISPGNPEPFLKIRPAVTEGKGREK